MITVGYARVSTADQQLDDQIAKLTDAGAERVYSEHASGRRTERKELTTCLASLEPGQRCNESFE